jgi:hypothetical protein
MKQEPEAVRLREFPGFSRGEDVKYIVALLKGAVLAPDHARD